MTVKRDGQKKKGKKSKLAPNSVALGLAVLGARASLYLRQGGVVRRGRLFKCNGPTPYGSNSVCIY